MGEVCVPPCVDLHTVACVDVQHSDFGFLQVKSLAGPSSNRQTCVRRRYTGGFSSLLVCLLSNGLTLNGAVALIFLFCFVFYFLGSFQTPCQQELDQVLERISTMRLPDERGPLEHLYSLHIPNCDKHGLYNLKQVSGETQSPRAGHTPRRSPWLNICPLVCSHGFTCSSGLG